MSGILSNSLLHCVLPFTCQLLCVSYLRGGHLSHCAFRLAAILAARAPAVSHTSGGRVGETTMTQTCGGRTFFTASIDLALRDLRVIVAVSISFGFTTRAFGSLTNTPHSNFPTVGDCGGHAIMWSLNVTVRLTKPSSVAKLRHK
jgi:hypothetical protein